MCYNVIGDCMNKIINYLSMIIGIISGILTIITIINAQVIMNYFSKFIIANPILIVFVALICMGFNIAFIYYLKKVLQNGFNKIFKWLGFKSEFKLHPFTKYCLIIFLAGMWLSEFNMINSLIKMSVLVKFEIIYFILQYCVVAICVIASFIVVWGIIRERSIQDKDVKQHCRFIVLICKIFIGISTALAIITFI